MKLTSSQLRQIIKEVSDSRSSIALCDFKQDLENLGIEDDDVVSVFIRVGNKDYPVSKVFVGKDYKIVIKAG